MELPCIAPLSDTTGHCHPRDLKLDIVFKSLPVMQGASALCA